MKTCNDVYKHQPIAWDPLQHGTDECPLCAALVTIGDLRGEVEDLKGEHGELRDNIDWVREELRVLPKKVSKLLKDIEEELI